MPSDKSTVATKADFVPTVVGGTDRERSIASSAPRAHDGTSQQPRPEVHQTQFNVLSQMARYPRNRDGERARRPPTPPYLPIKLHIIIILGRSMVGLVALQ